MRYIENPNLGLNTVTTYRGETEYRINCRKVKDQYYIKNVDIFFLEKKWYILDNGNIEYDHELKTMVIKKYSKLVNGVIGFEKNGNSIMGYFSKNKYNNITIQEKNSQQQVLCISFELALQNGYVRTNRGYLVYKDHASRKDTEICNSQDYRRGTYNADDDPDNFDFHKHQYEEYPLTPEKNLFKLSKYLGDTTFGTEIESIQGYTLPNILTRHGVIVCRDGSLTAPDGTQGPEYVTVPYSGAKGLQSLKNLFIELSHTNVISYNCALHFHFGNISKDRLFLTSLYKLGNSIQNDLYKMFPKYKEDEVKYAGKQKNYCKKLKNLIPNYEGSTSEDFKKFVDDGYKILFTWLVEGKALPTMNLNRNMRHPQNNKWERNARYHWLNFMNMFFSNRDTIEFRLHTPTLNYQKAIYWLFICRAIILYTETNSKKIIEGEKTSIKDVLFIYKDVYKDSFSETLSNKLLEYYNMRCDYFKTLSNKMEYAPNDELDSDKTFTIKNSLC